MRPAIARLVETLPAVFAVGTLGVVVLLAVLGMGSLVPVAAAVGWLLLTPLAGILVYVVGVTDDPEVAGSPESVRDDGSAVDTASESDETTDGDPLATLRDRYARGDIDDVEFERRLERLLETEDIELPPGATLAADADDEHLGERDDERETAWER